jgi:hydrogenase maturation protein HypF
MFHRTVSKGVADLLEQSLAAHPDTGDLDTIPLSGGVFQNEILCSWFATELLERGLKPLFHRTVPTNDGGISLGQACYGILALQQEE